MELGTRCILVSVTIGVLAVFLFGLIGIAATYNKEQADLYSVSDLYRIKPASSFERLFCPNYTIHTNLSKKCGISNTNQKFELYSMDGFEDQNPEYMEQHLPLWDARRLDPDQHYTFTLHEVLPGSNFSVNPCMRPMHNSEWLTISNDDTPTLLMIIQGVQNLSAVKENLSPEKSIDQICNGHCLASAPIPTYEYCLPPYNSSFSFNISANVHTLDDFHLLCYNPKGRKVVANVQIDLYRRHWNIPAMGGRQIGDPPSTRGFDSASLKSLANRSYFVSFRFHNDNLGGELCPIHFHYQCTLRIWAVVTVASMIGLAIVIICCCCVLAQGKHCYGYTRMSQNEEGRDIINN